MTGTEPSLSELVERFAAMPREDRAAVLAGLGEDERARLLPLLADNGQTVLSPALSALVGLCRIAAAPGVTRRVSAILAEAVPSHGMGSGRSGSLAETRLGPLDRFAMRWRGAV